MSKDKHNAKDEKPKEEKKEQELTKEEQLANEISKLKKQIAEWEEKYIRVLAESENARKRMLKEREEAMKYAQESAFEEMLQPLDNFEKALQHAESSSPEIKNWAVGFEMIARLFKQVLLSHGITEYESLHKHFDPHLHEAIEVVETDEHEKGRIIEEFFKGYRRGDRIIRPAKVKVVAEPKKEVDESKENKKEE